MLEVINLPQVGESIVEGTIAKWLKQPGESIKQYEPLVEVITDKVTMEVPSPVEGIITKLLAQEGETVAVGSPILELNVQNETTSEPVENNSKVSRTGFLVDNITQVGPTGGIPTDAVEDRQSPESKPPASRISPAVRRLAQELSINLKEVQGTGINGRITKNDLLAFQQPPEKDPTLNKKTTAIRKTIANHMMESYTQIPHAWTMIEVDVTNLVDTRSRFKEKFASEMGFNLTFMPFFIEAIMTSLKNNMNFNAEWKGNEVEQHININLGIAVASPTGLIVPVIHQAESLNFKQLATQANALINKANTNKLEINDVQDGTFTINNTGALGSLLSKPIINQNQSGIITMEVISRRPHVVGDGISIRSMMNICLAFDHRLNDGYEASKLLNNVKDYLENIPSTFSL